MLVGGIVRPAAHVGYHGHGGAGSILRVVDVAVGTDYLADILRSGLGQSLCGLLCCGVLDQADGTTYVPVAFVI